MTFKINGVAVATPQTFDVTYSDIDADTSGRNANGTMIRDIIVKNKTKLSIKWPQLSQAQSKVILDASNGDFFTVTYPDPLTNGDVTKTFYAGDRSMGHYSWHPEFNAYAIRDLGFDCIER
ncbi:DUF6711 family protein [Pseudolactococcus reticulitermitis]|uniref:Prophage protein n=1 Tax=Pseudolactococcus reticulitermitis TaxID=2025039 RepID=A0A224XAS4_9LACT|nr:DUF6711 family protein [Lactococcus reticulitermitis]GAX46763.1 hypothetical protein RsY01_342 [Lactococcus reticulitermitis]